MWDSVIDQFKYFEKDEQKTLKTLHEFILDSNGIIVPRENLLIQEIEKILSLNSSNKEQELTEKILKGFEINLKDYQILQRRMHQELDSIKWIKNQSWKKEMKLPSNTKKKLVVDKKGAYSYE